MSASLLELSGGIRRRVSTSGLDKFAQYLEKGFRLIPINAVAGVRKTFEADEIDRPFATKGPKEAWNQTARPATSRTRVLSPV
jgi:hypothetical protein